MSDVPLVPVSFRGKKAVQVENKAPLDYHEFPSSSGGDIPLVEQVSKTHLIELIRVLPSLEHLEARKSGLCTTGRTENGVLCIELKKRNDVTTNQT